MQALELVFFCLCLAGSTRAQKPGPCTSPPLLSGSFSKMDSNGTFGTYGKYRYDALGKKVRFVHVEMNNNTPTNTDLLMLFNERVVYQINWRRFTCKKMALKTPFQPMEVPHDAMFAEQIVLGTSSAMGQGLLVNNWFGVDIEANAHYMMTFTGIGCIPVTTMYYTEDSGWRMISFYNTLIGIDDPQLFIPPEFCNKAQLEGTTSLFDAIFEDLQE